MPDTRNPAGVQPTDLLTAEATPELVTELLYEVIDPELGVNIVDLGLVYEVTVQGGAVAIRMTLTTPACPLGGYIEDQIRAVLEPVESVTAIDVDIVFEPRWGPEQMSDDAKQQMGWWG